ncbi:hypothetical protein [Natronorubrum sp. FCH18a]|uniref:hypothetical protein n=1 Tax=Natronorubrum sp. FCH18a TaxID=3447018 RepID=UPI003F5145E2
MAVRRFGRYRRFFGTGEVHWRDEGGTTAANIVSGVENALEARESTEDDETAAYGGETADDEGTTDDGREIADGEETANGDEESTDDSDGTADGNGETADDSRD